TAVIVVSLFFYLFIRRRPMSTLFPYTTLFRSGGVVWVLWSMLINVVLLAHRYTAAQEAGLLLKAPRYSFFIGYWIVTLFLASYILAWLYASARATLGAGFGTALKIGLVGGFLAGFPLNLSTATWAPVDRIFP